MAMAGPVRAQVAAGRHRRTVRLTWLLQWQADLWLAWVPVHQEAPSVPPRPVLPVADHQKATRLSRHHLLKSRGLQAGVQDNGLSQFSCSRAVHGHFPVAQAVTMFVLPSSMEALPGQPLRSIHIQTSTFFSICRKG